MSTVLGSFVWKPPVAPVSSLMPARSGPRQRAVMSVSQPMASLRRFMEQLEGASAKRLQNWNA
jgi:hypothetical protein